MTQDVLLTISGLHDMAFANPEENEENEPIEVIGASRTDSGVHARGNIAVFDTHARMPADKICICLLYTSPSPRDS